MNQHSDLIAFIRRLHFYIGFFIGPFIFIAALTGTLYVLTPQLEGWVYHHELTAPAQGKVQPLSTQVNAALQSLDKPLTIKSVRPAPQPGDTTRVLFRDPTLTKYRARTVFVDPVSLEIRGTLASYGTSGVLPLRIAIDFMHKDLLLGDVGRYYSELAASWMWIAALGGIILWWRQKAPKRRTKFNTYARHRHNHSRIGIWISLGLLFFSATGLTWSKWAGANIAQWRHTIGWVTPTPSRHIPQAKAVPVTIQTEKFDEIQATARHFGIDANKIEIVPAYQKNQAWMVKEIDRRWPTQVDSVAINPQNLSVISHAEFEKFPLVAKLIRWGIDAHMGVLFGLINQIILALFGISLCCIIVFGYAMWWKKRPQAGNGFTPLRQAWAPLSIPIKCLIALTTLVLSLALPVLGISVILFCVFDVIRWQLTSVRAELV
ncbi:PepSY-associated TM helix domain-containing protein [Vibrio nitrifigilis]|uniref:PepSY domain-containing protein n=1 Tax=Vibrio nitrifigilis TaxID=2789781 RepID=A0ABS0GN59_9VIBR|nr:PepSY-associated TM helix domain-containing protein [Vibrio nitrifigilis]MBF9001022.1 PepSY domain-containing protein [Vibrio nitrifigilis]MBF9003608.1 PepSY domain-containing protein [Vibrio nitrifigilis]